MHAESVPSRQLQSVLTVHQQKQFSMANSCSRSSKGCGGGGGGGGEGGGRWGVGEGGMERGAMKGCHTLATGLATTPWSDVQSEHTRLQCHGCTAQHMLCRAHSSWDFNAMLAKPVFDIGITLHVSCKQC